MDLAVHWWKRHVAERYTAVISHVAVDCVFLCLTRSQLLLDGLAGIMITAEPYFEHALKVRESTLQLKEALA
jgi:hypothetical protein